MATSANIIYDKLYTIGTSRVCWFQLGGNGVGRQGGREDMSKTKMALNSRLRLQIFHVTVKRPSKVGQRKVRSLVRNRNTSVKLTLLCYSRYVNSIPADSDTNPYYEETNTSASSMRGLMA